MITYVNRNWLPFYFWFCSMLLLASGAYYAGIKGIYQIVYNSDATHITQVIAAIVIIGIMRIGWISYKWTRKEYFSEDYHNIPDGTETTIDYGKYKTHVWDDSLIARIRKHYSEWWYASSMLVIFGLIGTLIGFSMVFRSIVLAIQNSTTGLTQAVILKLIPDMIVPIGTIFFPTICGLLGLAIITVQLKLFESFSGIFDEQYEVGESNEEVQ